MKLTLSIVATNLVLHFTAPGTGDCYIFSNGKMAQSVRCTAGTRVVYTIKGTNNVELFHTQFVPSKY